VIANLIIIADALVILGETIDWAMQLKHNLRKKGEARRIPGTQGRPDKSRAIINNRSKFRAGPETSAKGDVK